MAQRKPARAARKCYPQQPRAVDNLTLALDRFGLQSETIKIKASRKPLQQVGELVRQYRCHVLHLPLESNRFAPGQALF